MTATQTANRAAALARILRDPGDDQARLVYADVCEDEGDGERAEFVRAQVELVKFQTFSPGHRKEFNEQARIYLAKRATRLERGECESVKIAKAIEEGGRLYAHRRGELQQRECEMLELNWHEWSGRVATYCANFHNEGAFGVHFSRGFISSISLPLAAFMQHAGAIFREQPVTSVKLTDREPFGGSQVEWFWMHEVHRGNACLPDAIWSTDEISEPDYEISEPDFEMSDGSDRRARNFPTRPAALSALSTACVSYARQLAGLPPL